MRRVVAILWLVVALACAPAALAENQGDGFADGDVLKIIAFGREDLTGQYSVQPGPLLSLPLIGTVPLTGRTARQLETQLATAWENRLGSPMSVTVEFAQRAPFYVLGAVRTPGAYPYRSGLTVLQALAVGGGLATQLATGDSLRLDLLRERERRAQAIAKLARATLRQARLLAERDGRSEITLAAPFTLLPKPELDAILAEESRLLDSRARQFAIRQRLLSDQMRLGEAAIASFERQKQEMAAQQVQITREANRIRRVPGQQVRAFELEQRASSLETTVASIDASITRTKIEVETARNGIADLNEQRQREITESLLEAAQAISENQLTIASSQDVLAAAGVAVPGQQITFRLLRNGRDEVPGVVSTTLLHAGDLLEVELVSSGAPPAAATAGSP